MKRVTKEWFMELYPRLKALVEENPEWMGAAPEIRAIVHWVEADDWDMDLINKIILQMPLTLVLKLRSHGYDFPRTRYNEELED